ncbi:MAG: hypothetical protein QW334_04270 [Thermofilum sp.]
MEEFGAIVKIEIITRVQFYNKIYQHDFEAAIAQLSSGLFSPLLDIWRDGARTNILGFSDPGVDHLINAYELELDPRRRREILEEIDRRVAEAFPAFWLVYPCQGVIAREREGLYLDVSPWEIIIRGSGALRVRNKRSYLWCVWKTLTCEALTAGCLASFPAAYTTCASACIGTLSFGCITCVVAAGGGVVALCDSAWGCWDEMIAQCSK